MVRNGRRSTYRRAGRRGTRTLSTRRIFGNKSARAQANQINALRKRVSYVYRQCRPEIKITDSDIIQHYVPYSDETPYRLISLDMPSEGVGDNAMIGNVINVKDVHIYMNAMVQALSTGATTPTYLLQGGVPITMDYRIILFGLKASSDYTPDVNTLFELSTYAGDYKGYQMNSVKPFNPGSSSVVKIFYDRKFSLSTQGRVSRSHHLKLKGSQIYKFTRDPSTTYSKGRLFALIIPVLHFEDNIVSSTGQTYPFTPAGLFDLMTKFAYTDP